MGPLKRGGPAWKAPRGPETWCKGSVEVSEPSGMSVQSLQPVQPMEPLGPKIRRMRRRVGLTLDELAPRTAISKPYLSLIETGRVPNPPSDEKLRRLEQTLGFTPGELVTQAHLHRTPRDVRVVLQRLIARGRAEEGAAK